MRTLRKFCMLQAALLVLLCIQAGLGAGEAEPNNPVNVEGKHYSGGSSAVYVPCTRDIFAGTHFYGADKFPAAVDWIQRNQLLIEGISPMVTLNFTATGPLTGVQPVAIANSTGPLSTKAASWVPLFYLPEDAACNLGRATAQYQAAHPTGPLLVMNVSVLTGVINQEPGAWQPQGFYARVDSAKDGQLFGAQRLYDHSNRPNPIRSVTKAITAATFMALVDQGIMSLDGHAADYVPAFKEGQLAKITFRMLLSHTAGFPFIIDQGKALLDPYITLMESATIIAQEYPLMFPPGQGFMYTEVGFQVVGAAMEAATGRTFQSLVKQYITDPIGMSNTNIYNQWKAGYSTNPNPAFGGVSSPSNLRAFMDMLLARGVVQGPNGRQRRVLSEAAVYEITKPQPNTDGFGTLVGAGVDYYGTYMEQSGLTSAGGAAVSRCVVFGDMWYGLGLPLSQVKDGKAKNIVAVGGAGQLYMIANFDDPANAIIAGASNFQNVAWGYTVSATLISEVLARLPEFQSVSCPSSQAAAGSAASFLGGLSMQDLLRIG